MTDRQTQAVAEAIYLERYGCSLPKSHQSPVIYGRNIELAQAAIAASDAKYLKGLVEALKYYEHLEPEGFKAKHALDALPEDIRNG